MCCKIPLIRCDIQVFHVHACFPLFLWVSDVVGRIESIRWVTPQFVNANRMNKSYRWLLVSMTLNCSSVSSVSPALRCSPADSRVSSPRFAKFPARSGCSFKMVSFPINTILYFNYLHKDVWDEKPRRLKRDFWKAPLFQMKKKRRAISYVENIN